MANEAVVLMEGTLAETQALKAREFYTDNYTTLRLGVLEGNKRIVLGTKPYECRFCGGKPPERTFRKRAHAVSELLGNKIITSLYECDSCNERFSTFEDDLGKLTHRERCIGGVIGKNGIPRLEAVSRGATAKLRMEVKGDAFHFSHDAGDIAFVEDEKAQTLTLTYIQQPYRPLGAYKALCKSAFTLLPKEELTHFEELRQWLLQPDLTTGLIYAKGSYFCYSTIVPKFRPFNPPVVSLLRRNGEIDSPYMSLFVATGNASYQIFLPCPAKDAHLANKTVRTKPFPHIFLLRQSLIPAPVQTRHLDLNESKQTAKGTGTVTWRYGNKIRVG